MSNLNHIHHEWQWWWSFSLMGRDWWVCLNPSIFRRLKAKVEEYTIVCPAVLCGYGSRGCLCLYLCLFRISHVQKHLQTIRSKFPITESLGINLQCCLLAMWENIHKSVGDCWTSPVARKPESLTYFEKLERPLSIQGCCCVLPKNMKPDGAWILIIVRVGP